MPSGRGQQAQLDASPMWADADLRKQFDFEGELIPQMRFC